MIEKKCRVCKVVLNDDNWYASYRERGNYICRKCFNERNCLWYKENSDKVKAKNIRSRRKNGHLPMNENKECSAYRGISMVEGVLGHVFKDVEVMPMNNPGYDVICNKGKKIDFKGACMRKSRGDWMFAIRRNIIADYFLLLALDNREYLNPLHVWLIPGDVLNHLKSTSISPSTINKWDEYKLDIDKVSACCNVIKNGGDLNE